MNKRFPGFTVLVERALRLTCVLGVVALAACGGGHDDSEDSADEPHMASVQDTLSAGTRTRTPTTDGRTSGIILSEKGTRIPTRPTIVLSEKVQAPDAMDDESGADADE